MSAWWDDEHKLCLLTPDEIKGLPDGTVLTAIDDTTAILGKLSKQDEDDMRETRFGHAAWGVTGDHPLRLALLAKTKVKT